MKFRIPRKEKKKLKKRNFFHPPEEDGSILNATPETNQEEYDLYKSGELNEPFIITKKEIRLRKEEFNKKFHNPVEMSNEELKNAVDYICAKEFRYGTYNVLLEARNNPDTIHDYYTFINAYNLTKSKEEDCGNICCMAVDSAREKLKKK